MGDGKKALHPRLIAGYEKVKGFGGIRGHLFNYGKRGGIPKLALETSESRSAGLSEGGTPQRSRLAF